MQNIVILTKYARFDVALGKITVADEHGAWGFEKAHALATAIERGMGIVIDLGGGYKAEIPADEIVAIDERVYECLT